MCSVLVCQVGMVIICAVKPHPLLSVPIAEWLCQLCVSDQLQLAPKKKRGLHKQTLRYLYPINKKNDFAKAVHWFFFSNLAPDVRKQVLAKWKDAEKHDAQLLVKLDNERQLMQLLSKAESSQQSDEYEELINELSGLTSDEGSMSNPHPVLRAADEPAPARPVKRSYKKRTSYSKVASNKNRMAQAA